MSPSIAVVVCGPGFSREKRESRKKVLIPAADNSAAGSCAHEQMPQRTDRQRSAAALIDRKIREGEGVAKILFGLYMPGAHVPLPRSTLENLAGKPAGIVPKRTARAKLRNPDVILNPDTS